jgi:hypothetical protein
MLKTLSGCLRPTLLFNEDHPGRARVCGQKEIDEQAALGVGLKEKAEEFVAAGGEIYRGADSV